MKTAIVLTTADDSLLAFMLNFADSIRKTGDAAFVLCTQPFDARWQLAYESRGISLTAVTHLRDAASFWPPAPDIRLSEALTGYLRGANIVFFQGTAAFCTVRERRFRASQEPICVTFWDQLPGWLSNTEYPRVYTDLNSAFVARYAAQHSDFVVAASAAAVDVLTRWDVSPRILLTDAPEAWLTFYAEVQALKKTPRLSPPLTASVDICVPHFNHGKHLPQMLTSLERQNYKDFGVIVVDDCSTDQASKAVFKEMARKYPGWRFVVNETNQGPAATRDTLAQLSRADYLCYVDADDVVASAFVGRLLEAIQWSGDDCVVAPRYSFFGDGWPYDPVTEEIIIPSEFLYMPVGDGLTINVIDDMAGAASMIIHRQVFLDSKMPPARANIGYEDYEKFVRLAFDGYKMDILPEYLYFYRLLKTGVSATTDFYLNNQRVLLAYQEVLAPLGLVDLPLAIKSLYLEVERLRKEADYLNGSLPDRP